jgi:ribose/xylose/arabinose/galactoside ABC-type transport system permease subunit
MYALLDSPLSVGMLSSASDDKAAANIGVDVWRNRFVVYVTAGCGLAGCVSFVAAVFITAGTAFDLNGSSA